MLRLTYRTHVFILSATSALRLVNPSARRAFHQRQYFFDPRRGIGPRARSCNSVRVSRCMTHTLYDGRMESNTFIEKTFNQLLTHGGRLIYGRGMITRADRIRWSDIRARLSQGERVPDADYHFFRSKAAAIRAINQCGLARSCRHWRRVGNKSNPVFDARAKEAIA